MRASLDDWKDSRGLKGSEERRQSEVSQLKELLSEKDQQSRSNAQRRRARTSAHIDTLALLSEKHLRSHALEEKLCKQLAGREERHQKEREWRVRKGLSADEDRMMEELNDSEEKMRQQLPERGALEETLMAKDLKP